MTASIPRRTATNTPPEGTSSKESPITDEKNRLDDLKTSLAKLEDRFSLGNRTKVWLLILSLGYMLTVNQFFIQIRFLIYRNDFFFQLIMPSIIALVVVYWVEDLEEIVAIAFVGLIIFFVSYTILINLPWLLGLIAEGGAITIFYNITQLIKMMPMIIVMVLLGTGVATILKAFIY